MNRFIRWIAFLFLIFLLLWVIESILQGTHVISANVIYMVCFLVFGGLASSFALGGGGR